MNKYRKAIADLIGVKTIMSEKLIINGIVSEVLNTYYYRDNEGNIKKIPKNIEYIFEFDNLYEYDITSVFKFIFGDGRVFNISVGKNTLFGTIVLNGKIFDFELPNKPLHLYSEEEDKKLLNDLTKLVGIN